MTSEKNILIVSKSADPGGLEFHVLDLIKGFSDANKVYLMVPDGTLVDSYKNAGAEVILFYPKSSLDIDFIKKTYEFCKKYRIHIVHANELINSQAVFSAFLAGVYKRVYHVHTPFLYWKYSNIFIKLVKTIPNWIINFITANFFSTDVICLTPQIKTHRIVNELIWPSKLKVIPNAVPVEKLAHKPLYEDLNVIKQKYGIPLNKVIIGTISRLSREKGHMSLLKSFDKLNKEKPNVYFLLLAGGGDLEEEYEKYAEEHFSKSYCITGKFEENEKIQLLYSIDYAVFPSLAEGFGYVLTEFMSAQIPTLASDLPVLKYVGGTGIWYFRRGDYLDLYSNLNNILIMSDALINEKTSKAFKEVQKYSIEAFIQNYSVIYGN
ncbi:hypothetical protein COV24_02020 [candidate division WWE3 bacterium CG10_big_fil_rev_8_21_14_0_10_32_10]|uniref:Glycosyltransferase family 1 protein n=1 Tax=candidate division WWE3 bacterium CG10_big_fil_rev_8_21_14_0_10_32_10 TaxID=1975090 RepID=A0A2H0RAM6_UNCKA|nr:MAG: hypothetical protein COV24_02020 [candidate division WWE3 bacterium CG10_big_fil_rev_8_21_14_0_10_32_10]